MSNEVSIYRKLTDARVMLKDKNITKSGNNDFGNFDYYELGDFIDEVKEINKELGILSVFNFFDTYAQLAIIDVDTGKEITFKSPISTLSNKKMQPIQELGSIHTYLKRYLYINAYEIIESDVVDALQQEINNNHYSQFNPQEIVDFAESLGISKEDVMKQYGLDNLFSIDENMFNKIMADINEFKMSQSAQQ